MRYIRLVRQFNTAFNCGAPPRPGLPGSPTPQQRIVRIQIIGEELSELAMAMAARDMIKCLDALCDLQYTIDGAFVIYGSDQAGYDVPNWDTNAAGPPRIPSVDACLSYLAAMHKTLGELAAVMMSGDWRSVSSEVLAMRGGLATLWAAFRVPEEVRWELFQEVHRSNMTKLVDGKPVLNAAGRVHKPPTYEPCDLRRVLAEHGWMVQDEDEHIQIIEKGAVAC